MRASCSSLHSLAQACVLLHAVPRVAFAYNRHDRLLQMYGQKDEELQQLQSDFVDVKKMFQEQINTLLLQMDKARNT